VLAESAHDLLGRGVFQIGKDGEKELLSTKNNCEMGAVI
jgi:hypothetical protein